MLFTGILLLLISNAVTFRRDKSILFARLTILILTNCSILLYSVLSLSFLSKSISLFGGLVYCKTHTLVFTLFIFSLTIFILSLSSFYPRKVWHEESASLSYVVSKRYDAENTPILNKMGEQFRIIEYPLIILFVITGATFLIASSDLVTIFLAIELQSYGLYLLSTIYRNSELSTNAGLTYFLLGGLSSCIILLGQSLLYINSGNTNLDGIYIINSILVNNVDSIDNTSITNIPNIYQYYIQLSFVIMSVGLLFKISSAPFHFWSPDVYDAIPTIVTTFVAIIAKISILILLLEFVYYTSITMLDYSWKSNLLLSASLSLIIGSVLGLTQFRIKRLFAYSTISHIGFILLALSINTIESIQAFFFYIMQYSISNLNAFIILITIGYSFVGWKKNQTEENVSKENHSEKELKDKNLSPIQLIHQLKGYFYMNPLLSISLAITLFSFIGVPPLLGFFAKQMILSAALDNGYVFISLLAILTSVISAVYYLVVISEIFFEKPEYTKEENNSISSTSAITLSSSLTGKISVLTLTILLFIFIPKEILCLNNIMSILLFYN